MEKASGTGSGDDARGVTHVREAIDADCHDRLKADPSDEDAKLDVALDESFPTSDAPAQTRPGSNDPAPSSGFDEEAERVLARKAAWRSAKQRLTYPLLVGGGALAITGVALVMSWRSRKPKP